MGKEYLRSVTAPGLSPYAPSLLLFDDFEHIIKPFFEGTGDDDVHEIDPSLAFTGSNSLILKTRTTGPGAGDYLNAIYYTYAPPSLQIHGEIRFNYPTIGTVQSIRFLVDFYNGSFIYHFALSYLPNVPKWQYLDYQEADQDLTGALSTLMVDTWHRLAFHLDLKNLLYSPSHIDHASLEVPSVAPFKGVATTSFLLMLKMRIQTAGAAPASCNFDNITLIS